MSTQVLKIAGVDEGGVKAYARKLYLSFGQGFGFEFEDCYQQIALGILEAQARDPKSQYSPASRLWYGYRLAQMALKRMIGIKGCQPKPREVYGFDDVNYHGAYEQDFDRNLNNTREEVSYTIAQLTQRQQLICDMLAAGKPRKEIATLCGISKQHYYNELNKIRETFRDRGLGC